MSEPLPDNPEPGLQPVAGLLGGSLDEVLDLCFSNENEQRQRDGHAPLTREEWDAWRHATDRYTTGDHERCPRNTDVYAHRMAEQPLPVAPPAEREAFDPFAAPIGAGFGNLGLKTDGGAWLDCLGAPGLFIEGGIHLLAGHPEGGKSELLFQLAHAWAADRPVLFFTEEPRYIWQARQVKWPARDQLSVHFVHSLALQQMWTHLHRFREGIVIIDTLRAVFQWPEENEAGAMNVALSPWINEIRTSDLTCIMTHHLGKNGQIAGSHVLQALCDVTLKLLPVPDEPRQRQLQVTGRAPIEPLLFTYQMGENGLLAAALSDRELVTGAMDGQGWLVLSEIAEACRWGRSHDTLRRLLDDLGQQGIVSVQRRGERSPTVYRFPPRTA